MEHIRRHRNRSSSSSSSSASPDARTHKSSSKRTANRLSAAVGAYLAQHKLKEHKHKHESGNHSSSDDDSHKATKLMMMAVAKHLWDKKHNEHKYRKVAGSTVGTGSTVTTTKYTTEEDYGFLDKNKDLVKAFALATYPMIKQQVKMFKAQEVVNADGTVSHVRPKIDKTMAKAIAMNVTSFIKTQIKTPVAGTTTTTSYSTAQPVGTTYTTSHPIGTTYTTSHPVETSYVSTTSTSHPVGTTYTSSVPVGTTYTSSVPVGTTYTSSVPVGTTYTSTSVPITTETTTTSLARKEMLKSKAAAIMARLHGTKTFSDEEVVENPHKHRALKIGAGVASAYLLKKAIGARKHRKTVNVEGKVHKTFRRRSVSSSSSSSSDDESNGMKKAMLTGAASFVARQMVAKMNRRRERKVLRREERVVTEPSKLQAIKTKLAEHRARSSSSSSSSSDEETHHRKGALLTAATGVAEHLMKKRLEQRRSKYTEQEYTSKLGAIKDKLTRTRSVSVSSDEDSKQGFKNKALVTAATLMAQQMVKKQYRKTYATPLVATERKRHTTYRLAAGLATQVFLRKLLKQNKHKETVKTTETHLSKADALKQALHRNRSASSSSSSSSSSDEESHKKRKLAVLMAAARIAKHAAVKGQRRAERKTLRRQVVVESEPSKLHMLKNRLAELRAASSSSSSSSSDEESHNKKAVLLASTAAIATALLRKRYRARKPLYTEQVYREKVSSIPQTITTTTLAGDLSEDDAIKYGRKSRVMLGGQKMFNRLTKRSYRENYDAYAGQYRPNTWVKLSQGVSLSLLRDSIKRRHLRHGVASTDPTFVNNDPTRVGTTPGLISNIPTTTHTTMPTTTYTTAPTTTYTTMPTTTYTTAPTTTHTTMPMTTSSTTTTSTLPMTNTTTLAKNYELIDAAVKVKRAGHSSLTYDDLGYFVTLRVDPTYLASQGHISAGAKVKNLLRGKGPNTLVLDSIIDEPTKLIIKESLGLNPLDIIRLEYTGLDKVTSSSSSSADEAYHTSNQTFVTPADARLHNASKMDRLKAKFHRHKEPMAMTTETYVDKSEVIPTTTGHMSTMDKLKSKLHHHGHTEAM